MPLVWFEVAHVHNEEYNPAIARRNEYELLKYDARVYRDAKSNGLTTLFHSVDGGASWRQLPSKRTAISILQTCGYLPDWPFVLVHAIGWRNDKIAVAWSDPFIANEDAGIPRRYVAELQSGDRWKVFNIGPNGPGQDPWWRQVNFQILLETRDA